MKPASELGLVASFFASNNQIFLNFFFVPNYRLETRDVLLVWFQSIFQWKIEVVRWRRRVKKYFLFEWPNHKQNLNEFISGLIGRPTWTDFSRVHGRPIINKPIFDKPIFTNAQISMGFLFIRVLRTTESESQNFGLKFKRPSIHK